ncbi:hypothetical protein [Ornithinimicrobium murale]|uniref:hypothetical protein n=1 Tax=Ornithinimicrobium murale TaxID=1050153 RepID=UPI000E0DAE8D|nr:hypothetical protein [Ornithinimicrobium murale]
MISRTAAPQLAPRPRRLAAAGFALVAALSLSACQISSPVTTDMNYDPADGVSVDAGDIAVRDLLVVSEGGGAAGVVSGLVVNNATEPADVTLTIDSGGQAVALNPTVTVAPGQALRLDGQSPEGSGEAVQVPSVEVNPGSTLTIVVQTSLGEAGSGLAPVLLPDGPYGDLVATTADSAT